MKITATVTAILFSCVVLSAFGQAPLPANTSKTTPDAKKAQSLASIPYFKLGFGRLAEEGLHLENWFVLGSVVEGLGKEGDLIATMHGTKMGRVTSIFLVNVKEEKCLVVLPAIKSPNQVPEDTARKLADPQH